ncbi:hypothetical protein P5V15_007751 [Pogonomyrmex californicus]
MLCSPEEIERKRLLALQRKQQAQLKTQSILTNSPALEQSMLNNSGKTQNTLMNPAFQQSVLNNSGNVARHEKPNNRFNPIESKNFFNQVPNVTGKCYMISNDRFALDVPFIPAIINLFRTIPSRSYDPKTKIWNFHINDYNNLLKKLHPYMKSVTGIPEDVFQLFKKYAKSNNQIPELDLLKIDKKLTYSLMPFQQEGVCYGISKNGRCMIADEMGLGKTIQALGIAHYFKESWPLLIVAPSSVKYQWSAAIYDFLPSVPTHYVHHFLNARDCIDDDKITIISYNLLHQSIDTIAKYIYGFVILDESHVLKNMNTAKFQAVRRICTHARHVVLLTGTPALSRPIELYSQISLILPRFMRYEDYGVRYCNGRRNAFGWDFTGCSNMQELQLLLKVTCMIRRMKTDTLNQLPSKTRQVIILDPLLVKAGTKEMEKMSQQMQKQITGLERHNALVQYYTESSYARLKAICKYVTNLFENKKKCLLYAHHQNVLDAICEIAESMDIRYIRIDGKTNPEQRKLQVDKFQECDNYLAAILSITAANAGITLTAARLVVFTELFWNPGVLCQAEDRVHRIGQKHDVTIQYLVAKDTADDYIWPLINKKQNVLNSVGLEQDFSIHNVDATAQKESNQKDLSSFLDSSSKTESQSQHEQDSSSSIMQNNKELIPEPESTSADDFKDLLEDNEELFDSCGWDNIM